MKKILSIVIATLFLCGCYNSKKATEQVDKALTQYPETAAKQIRDKFPCVTTEVKAGDSTAIKEWMDATKRTAQFYEDLLANMEPQIEVRKDLSDSVKVEILLANLKKCNDRTDILSKQITSTKEIIRYLPAIHDTAYIKDNADVFLANEETKFARIEMDKYKSAYDGQQQKLKNKTRNMWLLLALVIGLLIWTFRRFFGSFLSICPIIFLALPPQMQDFGWLAFVLPGFGAIYSWYLFFWGKKWKRDRIPFTVGIILSLATIAVLIVQILDLG